MTPLNLKVRLYKYYIWTKKVGIKLGIFAALSWVLILCPHHAHLSAWRKRFPAVLNGHLEKAAPLHVVKQGYCFTPFNGMNLLFSKACSMNPPRKSEHLLLERDREKAAKKVNRINFPHESELSSAKCRRHGAPQNLPVLVPGYAEHLGRNRWTGQSCLKCKLITWEQNYQSHLPYRRSSLFWSLSAKLFTHWSSVDEVRMVFDKHSFHYFWICHNQHWGCSLKLSEMTFQWHCNSSQESKFPVWIQTFDVAEESFIFAYPYTSPYFWIYSRSMAWGPWNMITKGTSNQKRRKATCVCFCTIQYCE